MKIHLQRLRNGPINFFSLMSIENHYCTETTVVLY